MTLLRCVVFYLFIVTPFLGTAQIDFEERQQDLAFYADVLVNARAAQHRERAHETFYTNFKTLLDEEGSFDFPFDSLHWISIQDSPDNTFRFITWQLMGQNNSYAYYGFYQDKTSLIELNSTVDFDRNLVYEDITPDNWYGQLIYDIVPVDDYYMIFGFRQIDQFTKTKVADVMRKEDGKLTFGAPIFKTGESAYKENMSRVVIQYSADVLANLTYNPGLNMLVFDNLIERMGRIPGQGQTLLPDGTYKAYKNDGENWTYVNHLYEEIVDEKPKTGNRKEQRDIFGKGKN